MHLAVAQGAKEGVSFVQYVDFLSANGYVPPGGREWVDHIRKMGNQANHKIQLFDQESAQELLSFIEMLLKFIYEFPERVRRRTSPSDA